MVEVWRSVDTELRWCGSSAFDGGSTVAVCLMTAARRNKGTTACGVNTNSNVDLRHQSRRTACPCLATRDFPEGLSYFVVSIELDILVQ